ncbi:DNA-binding response regulator, LytR/AlgR family [bacterium A37T11]|nr:DNA-binding response regulator, LytR/AlgR family [bacterium A37T11]
MNPHKICTYVLIEDNPEDQIRFARIALKFNVFVCKGTYTTVQEAIDDLELKRLVVDVVFCDVELFDLNGLEYGIVLTKYCRFLTYITAFAHYEEFVLRKKGDACLIKPVTEMAMQVEVLDRLYRRHGHHLPITIDFGKLMLYDSHEKAHFPVSFEQILYVQAADNYLSFFLEGDERKMLRCPLTTIMHYLEPVDIFLQVNPGIIVNTQKITRSEPALLYLKDRIFKVTDKYLDRYKLFREFYGF